MKRGPRAVGENFNAARGVEGAEDGGVRKTGAAAGGVHQHVGQREFIFSAVDSGGAFEEEIEQIIFEVFHRTLGHVCADHGECGGGVIDGAEPALGDAAQGEGEGPGDDADEISLAEREFAVGGNFDAVKEGSPSAVEVGEPPLTGGFVEAGVVAGDLLGISREAEGAAFLSAEDCAAIGGFEFERFERRSAGEGDEPGGGLGRIGHSGCQITVRVWRLQVFADYRRTGMPLGWRLNTSEQN